MTPPTPPSPRACVRSRSSTRTRSTSPTTSIAGRTRCRPTSRASSSSWRCRRAAGARCASTWAPCAARSTSTSRTSACRSNRSAYSRARRDNFYAVADDVATVVGTTARDVFILADGLTDDDPDPVHDDGVNGVWGIAEVSPDDAAGSGNFANEGGLTGMMLDPALDARPTRRDWQPTVMLHEITHNLGGVQQSARRHSTHLRALLGRQRRHVLLRRQQRGPSRTRPACAPSSRARSRRPTTAATTTTSTPIRRRAATWPPIGTSTPARSWGRAPSSAWPAATRSCPRRRSTPRCRAVGGQARPGCAAHRHARARGSTARPATSSSGSAPSAATGRPSRARSGPATSPPPPTRGAALRAVVTATNEDGSAVVASAPTAPVVSITPVEVLKPKVKLSILLRDRARHAKGTLAARVVAVPAGREVRTDAVKVAVTPGTWRLRLCAGPTKGTPALRAVQARAHAPRTASGCPPRRCSCAPRAAP